MGLGNTNLLKGMVLTLVTGILISQRNTMENRLNKNHEKIQIIDQTIREGMQFRGVVFSLAQRLKILEFQEQLGVSVCQAGYPAAHEKEADIVAQVAAHAKEHGFSIRTAALGRAVTSDARTMISTGVDDIHFHFHVNPLAGKEDLAGLFKDLEHVISHVRAQSPCARISMAMLDLGRTAPDLLETCLEFLGKKMAIDMISLPDTSGIMTPVQVYEKIKTASALSGQAVLSVHCHNDMGAASANAFMGSMAGARVLEASALGIGERNGICDLYATARLLENQGVHTGLNLDNVHLFKEYYSFVDTIVYQQTGAHLLGYTFPGFGEGIRTHVAGTHAGKEFGTIRDPEFYLNVLCGKGLVSRYLNREIPGHTFSAAVLDRITSDIKLKSITLGRCLENKEIRAIAEFYL